MALMPQLAQRRPLWQIRLGWAIFAAVSFFIGSNLWVKLEAEGRLSRDPAAFPKGAVAVVLGCNEFHEEGWRIASYHPRLDAAATLAASGRVRLVIVSGYLEQAYAMAAGLRQRGVTVPIVLDPFGWRTIDSVIRAQTAHPNTPLIFVSQAWHVDRAIWQARRLDIAAYGMVAVNGPGFRARFTNPARDLLAKPKAVLDWMVGFPLSTEVEPSVGFR
jgi:SanA protein